jgi:hypothetical protein
MKFLPCIQNSRKKVTLKQDLIVTCIILLFAIVILALVLPLIYMHRIGVDAFLLYAFLACPFLIWILFFFDLALT